jgi:hypothetical protein
MSTQLPSRILTRLMLARTPGDHACSSPLMFSAVSSYGVVVLKLKQYLVWDEHVAAAQSRAQIKLILHFLSDIAC